MILTRRGLFGAAGAMACVTAAPAEALLLSPRPRKRPPPRPRRLVVQAGISGAVSYAVLDAQGGFLTGRDPDRPVAPASTIKMLTALYALDALGGDHRFPTRVLRAGDLLILVGGGDPTLDTDRLAELARQTVSAGQPPAARFAVWGGALPYIAEIAAVQADHLAYNPSVSGMMLNFNRVHLGWQAGGAGMSLQARAEGLSPRAYTIAAEPVSGGPLFAWRDRAGRELWEVNRAGLRRAGSRWLPVRHPELYAGDVFQTLCRAEGLPLPMPEVIEDLPGVSEELAAIRSAPLADILSGMLTHSTNLTAEVVGLHASGARDLRRSAQAMQHWAEARGLSGLSLWDHSGMSAETRVTARAMAQLLAGPGREAGLRDLLPELVAPEMGAAPRVHAKTGTLNFVSNLAGYGQAEGRGEVVFSIFASDMDRRAASQGQELPNGVVTWTNRARRLQLQLVQSFAAQYG